MKKTIAAANINKQDGGFGRPQTPKHHSQGESSDDEFLATPIKKLFQSSPKDMNDLTRSNSKDARTGAADLPCEVECCNCKKKEIVMSDRKLKCSKCKAMLFEDDIEEYMDISSQSREEQEVKVGMAVDKYFEGIGVVEGRVCWEKNGKYTVMFQTEGFSSRQEMTKGDLESLLSPTAKAKKKRSLPSTVRVDPSSNWSCNECTFINSKAWGDVCTMCESPRKVAQPINAKDPPEKRQRTDRSGSSKEPVDLIGSDDVPPVQVPQSSSPCSSHKTPGHDSKYEVGSAPIRRKTLKKRRNAIVIQGNGPAGYNFLKKRSLSLSKASVSNSMSQYLKIFNFKSPLFKPLERTETKNEQDTHSLKSGSARADDTEFDVSTVKPGDVRDEEKKWLSEARKEIKRQSVEGAMPKKEDGDLPFPVTFTVIQVVDLGLRLKERPELKGLEVMEVADRAPADVKSNLHPGDLVIAVNNIVGVGFPNIDIMEIGMKRQKKLGEKVTIVLMPGILAHGKHLTVQQREEVLRHGFKLYAEFESPQGPRTWESVWEECERVARKATGLIAEPKPTVPSVSIPDSDCAFKTEPPASAIHDILNESSEVCKGLPSALKLQEKCKRQIKDLQHQINVLTAALSSERKIRVSSDLEVAHCQEQLKTSQAEAKSAQGDMKKLQLALDEQKEEKVTVEARAAKLELQLQKAVQETKSVKADNDQLQRALDEQTEAKVAAESRASKLELKLQTTVQENISQKREMEELEKAVAKEKSCVSELDIKVIGLQECQQQNAILRQGIADLTKMLQERCDTLSPFGIEIDQRLCDLGLKQSFQKKMSSKIS